MHLEKTKITITGTYDDSTACYFGGFVITDNYSSKLLKRENGPINLLHSCSSS